ncbi:septum formation family protein [Saccharomonospora xinjiangensis]|uniref:septum formation family protein n=1 Tax=Saccharomonospora xinjiangensis TaxID=75294 RepID=UPI0035100878
MSRQGLVLAGATLLVAVTVASCVTEVDGTAQPPANHAVAGNTDAASAAPSTGSAGATGSTGSDSERSGSQGAAEVADPGECVSGGDPAPIDCDEPHTVEITASGTFGGAMAEKPPARDEVFAAVFPSCRQEAAAYLGSDDYDLTTLSAWLLWAGEDAWARGERWYRCGVAELDKANEAKQRTGSVRNALRGDGVHTYRLCSLTAPSEAPPAPTPCDRPHRGEAVAVVPMGKHTDPLPSEEEFDAAAIEACEKAVTTYLGGSREDVAAAWRWPDDVAWKRGFTNLTCYAQTEAPVTASLRGVKDSPLPR